VYYGSFFLGSKKEKRGHTAVNYLHNFEAYPGHETGRKEEREEVLVRQAATPVYYWHENFMRF
jgi:hypothetical protein